jgi:hypothetical protein
MLFAKNGSWIIFDKAEISLDAPICRPSGKSHGTDPPENR